MKHPHLWPVWMFLMILALMACAYSQTRIASDQAKIAASPIASIERTKCDKSGQGWNCAGIQLLRMTLVDGTKLGPFIVVFATPEVVKAAEAWESIPIGAP